MFHLLSNTSNSYLSSFNETLVSRNLSEKRLGTLTMNKAAIQVCFVSWLHCGQTQEPQPGRSAGFCAGGAWQDWMGCGFTSAIAHPSRRHASLSQISLERKTGIANLLKFWMYSPFKHTTSQEDSLIRLHCLPWRKHLEKYVSLSVSVDKAVF